MQILVNGERHDVRATTLNALLDEMGYDATTRIATAVDGCFVAATRRAGFALHEGAQVEILAPMQGG
ncbi:thiamine biosynthesis protein ThiS [Komagataeibacter nataicola]|uniref:Thiamine biosynthesis protein ThiS n=1 Tax=Komagataeibacter nataicola TaxID=265960 RepID=A0A9N7H318_9PROT|nr:sulfur carrier protein ThiS [Komagataeibacter nataicola]AQU88500.1 thiamine biosynthesis protein ThiS [Komagataeibacter nataicola]PYD67197.1 thiamine biosynthesis protein ThiS [Komagataeibacter nataicola]WEQ57196.1 sulfur carrier protein ThiS [Komagataeibacter nataicola]WNM08783.1 sulfur carrier protein ThiS [Komagataeibacter nataicola]GBR17133.1 thiamine biosynthesis protein ThiS [Komagataeibacter nataicola NRIC 0616]